MFFVSMIVCGFLLTGNFGLIVDHVTLYLELIFRDNGMCCPSK